MIQHFQACTGVKVLPKAAMFSYRFPHLPPGASVCAILQHVCTHTNGGGCPLLPAVPTPQKCGTLAAACQWSHCKPCKRASRLYLTHTLTQRTWWISSTVSLASIAHLKLDRGAPVYWSIDHLWHINLLVSPQSKQIHMTNSSVFLKYHNLTTTTCICLSLLTISVPGSTC